LAEKSKDAFRTISEVADWLDVPTHVLRFWESRFAQIKPVKRAGGRRYYRPSDMRVIGGVKVLLHDQGMTIRGVQKLFREEGVKHVSGYSPALFDMDEEDETVLDAEALERAVRPAPPARATRTAEPAPVEPDEEESRPVFRRASKPAPIHVGDAPEGEPQLPFLPDSEAPAPEAAMHATETAEPKSGARAPLVSAAPEEDPADDDAAHDRGPGAAARLRRVPRRRIAADRARIEAAVARLKAVRDRIA
jgi:DNA-binding transcriptional MerR regulator